MQEEGSQERIKRSKEQWKWSEMQSLELISENPNIPLGSISEQEKDMEMEGENSKNADKEESSVGFMELFRFADRLDYVLMGIGTIGAFVHGCSLPIFLRFFADLVNSFGSNANDTDKMTREVLRVIFFFFKFSFLVIKISSFFVIKS